MNRLPLFRPRGVVLLLRCFGGAIVARATTPVIPVWPGTPPGSEGRSAPEKTRLHENGEHIVSSVHSPSLTVYLPASPAPHHAAVLVIPGGGYRELWMDHEGHAVARALNERGIAAFILKYRLPMEEGSTYSVETHALADAQRAVRLIRSRAAAFSIDPTHLGVMGFSAGGELAALTASRVVAGRPDASDLVERESSRPAFQALIYPATRLIRPAKDAPPAFLLSGGDDTLIRPEDVVRVYSQFRAAGVPAELHLLAHAGHGFGLRATNSGATAHWITNFTDWLATTLSAPARPGPGG